MTDLKNDRMLATEKEMIDIGHAIRNIEFCKWEDKNTIITENGLARLEYNIGQDTFLMCATGDLVKYFT